MRLNPRLFSANEPSEDMNDISEFVRRHFARESGGLKIIGLYLVGSQAEETWHDNSDTDIFIHAAIDRGRIYELRKRIADSINYVSCEDFSDFPRAEFVDPCIGNCEPYGRAYNLTTNEWEYFSITDERWKEFLANCNQGD